jgi:hypothetical protein
MQSKTAIQKTIYGAFRALDTACDGACGDAQKILRELVEAETKQEKGHRNFAPDGWRHKFGIVTVARYFIVRSVMEAQPEPTSWAEVAGYNARTQLAQQLRATLITRGPASWARLTADEDVAALLKLDYITEITPH